MLGSYESNVFLCNKIKLLCDDMHHIRHLKPSEEKCERHVKAYSKSLSNPTASVRMDILKTSGNVVFSLLVFDAFWFSCDNQKWG